jgi:hypothetical protein
MTNHIHDAYYTQNGDLIVATCDGLKFYANILVSFNQITDILSQDPYQKLVATKSGRIVVAVRKNQDPEFNLWSSKTQSQNIEGEEPG